jgi:hypothetical protein
MNFGFVSLFGLIVQLTVTATLYITPAELLTSFCIFSERYGSLTAITVMLGGALPVHKQTLVPDKSVIENKLNVPVS